MASPSHGRDLPLPPIIALVLIAVAALRGFCTLPICDAWLCGGGYRPTKRLQPRSQMQLLHTAQTRPRTRPSTRTRATAVSVATPTQPLKLPTLLDAEGSMEVLKALRKNLFPRNRRPVAFDAARGKWCRGCTIGLTQDYATGEAIPTAATRKRPELARVLTQACKDVDPDFRFTSIQVNLNTRYRMHTDGFDAGPSRMLCCGNFTEGRLWLHSWAEQKWQPFDCRDRWVAFDGREYHMTEPWGGPERYSLVYFTHPAWSSSEQLRPGTKTFLEDLGFPWPRSAADTFRAQLPKPSERRATATASLPPQLWAAEMELPREFE